ncbi:MAG: hypothetical protein GY712_11300 [Oceanicoccus sp.]|nr:hypothetical protein [Oceanicoccus sp.]
MGLTIACVHKAAFLLYYGHRYILKELPWRLFSRILRNGILSILAYLPFGLFIEVAPLGLWQWFSWSVSIFIWVGLVLTLGNVVFDWQTTRAIYTRMNMLFISMRTNQL